MIAKSRQERSDEGNLIIGSNVYIPQRLKDCLDQLAEKDRRSLNVTVEILLTEALDALEAKADKNKES
ncbi:MAG: hypothetical protein HC879_03545 [Leptolyngbyaceae cyanobacterium SL_5_9]|nr:hypothetical protein [Leptolyngbyaceae cyanobacterium SL_5_9]NJO73603.1 hypothetical protein [Leptolyngbyaceae cyanobacterium RM1_406_9]